MRSASDAARTGLQFDGAVAVPEHPRHFPGVVGIGGARPIIPAGSVGKKRAVLAAEQTVHRQARRLALDVPQRDVDPGDCRHDLGALAARNRRRHILPSLDRARPRRGQAKQLLPYRHVRQRIHAMNDLAKPRHPLADPRHRRAVDLAIADEPVVGSQFGQDDVPGSILFMRGPHRLRPRDRNHVRLDGCNPAHSRLLKHVVRKSRARSGRRCQARQFA